MVALVLAFAVALAAGSLGCAGVAGGAGLHAVTQKAASRTAGRSVRRTFTRSRMPVHREGIMKRGGRGRCPVRRENKLPLFGA